PAHAHRRAHHGADPGAEGVRPDLRHHERSVRLRRDREPLLPEAVHRSAGRAGLGHRGRPADPGAADPRLPGQELQAAGGEPMKGTMKDGRKRSPLAMIAMPILALLWTVPTLGLLITSLRSREAAASTGWRSEEHTSELQSRFD